MLTLEDDVTIIFSDDVSAEILKEIFIEVIQKTGNNYSITWPESVKTSNSIKIENNSLLDISTYLVGFSNDGGVAWNIGNVGVKVTSLNDSGLNPEYLPAGSITIDKISEFASNVTSEIDSWLSDAANEGLQWLQQNYSEIESNLDAAYSWVSEASDNVKSIIDTAASEIESALGGTYTNIKDWIDSASTNIRNVISSAGTEIETGLGSAYSNLKSWYNAINSFVRGALEDLSSSITEFIVGDDNSHSQGVYTPSLSSMVFFVGGSAPMKLDSDGTRFSDDVQIDEALKVEKDFTATTNAIFNGPVSCNDVLKLNESIPTGYAPVAITDFAILFGRPTTSGLTELRVKFQSGSSQLINAES